MFVEHVCVHVCTYKDIYKDAEIRLRPHTFPQALTLLDEMAVRHLPVDAPTTNAVLHTCMKAGKWRECASIVHQVDICAHDADAV